MVKSLRKATIGAVLGASIFVASPAAAGTVVFYYYDYVGGTPAGYQIICNTGQILEQWGNVYTGILIYHHQDVGC